MERLKSNSTLQESWFLEARLKAQSRALNEFDIVAETDVRGRITFVNDKFVEISKYSKDELLGQDHRLLNSGFHSKDFFRDLWKTIARSEVWRGDIRNRAKDGSFYWVSTVIVPILKPDGGIHGFLALRKDITQRKNLEHSLRLSESRYRQLLDNSNFLALGLDLSGNITFCNQPFLQMITRRRDEVLGKDFVKNFVPKVQQDVVLNHMLKALSGHEANEAFEHELLDGALQEYTVRWHQTLFEDLEGNVKGYTFIGEDLTEVRRQEKRIRELQEFSESQRQEIIAFIAHELRNPLHALRAHVDLIQMAGEDAGLKKTGLEKQCREMLNLLGRIDFVSRDLLESARDQAQAFSIEKQTFDLKETLETLLKNQDQESLNLRKIKIELQTPSTSVFYSGDEARLAQAFENILSNAIKYSKPSGGRICLSLSADENFFFLRFRDEGIGIAEDEQSFIFKSFNRARNAKEGGYQGFGLGLKIAKNFIEAHGGKISVISKLGEGSCFQIELPRTKSN